ncbi:MAG: glycosyltransferase family 2 protein [Alphaproteobacteria bacterium]|nr:glycosyltransferase family 2 protein [Alphaproteobacteria bacterium]
MYTIDDIDVYVITHNRCEFLKQTLDSVIHQTVRLNKITVLDNESVDDTEQVVAQYKKYNVAYYKTFERHGNFLKAQELTAANNTKYVMTFHDDDLLHPQFFEKMLAALNSLDYEPAGLMSAFSWFPTGNLFVSPPAESQKILPKAYLYPECLENKYIVIRNPQDLVQLILYVENPPYDQINPCICSVVYRKDCFLKRVPERSKYGIIDDVSIIMDLTRQGSVILLADNKAVFHRNHQNRDALNNGNSVEQSTEWVKLLSGFIEPTDMKSYQKLVNMIVSIYPSISSAECLKEYPTAVFVKKLIELGVIPQGVKVKDKKKKINFFTLEQYFASDQKNILQENKKTSFIKRIFRFKKRHG